MNSVNDIPKGWMGTTMGEVIHFANNKIEVARIGLENYVSTENLLANKAGVTIASSLPNISKVNKFEEGDTLFSNIRTYFKKVWYADKMGGSSNDILLFRPNDKNELDSKFLYYFISSDKFIDFTVKSAKGTKMPRGDKNAMKSLSFIIPKNIQEQKAIANILTAFDDKIENLQAQNKTLEQTAQTVFKEWFGKYQVGDELPDGWRVGELGEVTKSVGGTTPSTKNEDFWNGNIYWSSPKDLSNNEYIYLLSTEKKITEIGLKKISSGLLPKNTLLLSSRAPVGYLALTNIELAINQGYIAILPSQYFSNYYTLLWLKKNMKKVISAANGSTFLEISKSAFRIIDCVIPKKSKIEDFDKIVAPFFSKTLSNQKQIQTLKKTRDTLLPKLMSGQLRVNEFKEKNI